VTILLAPCDTRQQQNVGRVNMIVCMSQVLICFSKGEMNKDQQKGMSLENLYPAIV
jgi:hypothetical protein